MSRRNRGLDRAEPSIVLERRAGSPARVEDRLAEIFDSSPEPILGFDLDGRISYVNRAFCCLTGYPHDVLVGAEFPFPQNAPRDHAVTVLLHQAGIDGRAIAAGVESVRLRYRTSTGEEFPVLVTGGPIRLGDRAVGLIGFVHDLRRLDADSQSVARRYLERSRLYGEIAMSSGAPASPALDRDEEGGEPCTICSTLGAGRVSPREHDVLKAFLADSDSPQIAQQLGISEHTLRNHFKSIFRKLDVRSKLDLYRLLRH